MHNMKPGRLLTYINFTGLFKKFHKRCEKCVRANLKIKIYVSYIIITGILLRDNIIKTDYLTGLTFTSWIL